ncbi:unnamed protein product [Linum tenue]|uniref:F-box domain-containing protein n=1 Tax=Linum tenue TaxID=586396 RepID=A0AAV0NK72_9ROSI|nr:unnamed protein product [Linum tenue]
MKRVCESSGDRITNLPADVLKRILVLLPIKDAIKTATLSTKWRRQWKSIPHLVFHDDFAVQKGCPSQPTQTMTMMDESSLLPNIYKVLMLHNGPITKFELSIVRIFIGSSHQNAMDQIILHLSDHRGHSLSEVSLVSPAPLVYKLHSALFSCLHISRLRLSHCELRQPSRFVGFSKLRVLQLWTVTLPADFFENFLLKCPVLETLRVSVCPGTPNHLEIATPCLREFCFSGCFERICFKSTPLLKLVSIHKRSVYVENPPDMAAFFASLPALQRFSAEGYLIGLDLTAASDAIPALLEAEHHGGSRCYLQRLKEFEFRGIHGVRVELDLVGFVLASAPLLEKVHITPVGRLEPGKVFGFMKTVMQYKCASREAEVIYAGRYEG